MASKGEVVDNSISEKKRIRLEALEQRLTSADSVNLTASLSSPTEHQGKQKKKITSTGTKGCLPHTHATGKSPLASGTLPRSSELEDSEENPLYFQLCESVHENLIAPHLQHSNVEVGGNVINGILHDLLKSGDKYMRGSLNRKMDDKFLYLDNRTLQVNSFARARIRALHSRGKRSKKHMSKRQHRQCGSFNLPRKYQNYNVYVPMHELWKEYVRMVLRICRQSRIGQWLLTADFHGAIFAVLDSKNKSFTGVQGIMIRETTNTFGILTSENKFRVVPKKGSVFMFQVDFYRVILHGENLASRNLNQDI